MNPLNNKEIHLKKSTAKLDEWIPNKPLDPMIEPKSKADKHHKTRSLDSIGNGIHEDALEGETEDQAIERLSKLSSIEYEKVRKQEAKNLGLSRVGVLDAAVQEMQNYEQSKQSNFFCDDEPWPDSVDGEALLSDIVHVVHRYIICQPEVASAAALWIVMTYVMDSISVAPLAIITAPEKACGKTKFLELFGKLCFHPLPTSNISAAAVYRSIEAFQPTLLIDETDTFLAENEDLRGVINSGHTRSNAFVMRVDGDNYEPVRFFTFSAKVLCGIGNKNLHDTIISRAILFELRRKLPSETIERLRAKDDIPFKAIRQKILRWTADHRDAIERSDPEVPQTLSDREQDNWEALLVIADLAGGKWPALARNTAIGLSKKHEAKSFKAELLEDIRSVFEHKGIDRISSADLIFELCSDEEAAWKTYSRGKEISPKQLAGLLRGYGVISKSVRIGLSTPKGYEKEQFIEIWERYINTSYADDTCELSRHTPQANEYMGESVAGVPQHKTPSATEDPIEHMVCGGVADKSPLRPEPFLNIHDSVIREI
jgi:putative DNA primase/helicase